MQNLIYNNSFLTPSHQPLNIVALRYLQLSRISEAFLTHKFLIVILKSHKEHNFKNATLNILMPIKKTQIYKSNLATHAGYKFPDINSMTLINKHIPNKEASDCHIITVNLQSMRKPIHL